jgi:hypothetical protein
MMLKVSAAVLCLGLMSACTDLKPLRPSRRPQGAGPKLQWIHRHARAASPRAASAARPRPTARRARKNQALQAAQASQACCDATNEKIDRMFKKSVSK